MPLTTQVTLRRLSLFEISIPQVTPFRSAIGERVERRALLVRWTDEDGAFGIGECSCRPDPFFNGEFVAGAIAVLRDHLVPLLPVRTTLGGLARAVTRVRGWNFTVAALLDSAFDLLRRRGAEDPLAAAALPRCSQVPVGLSLGLFNEQEEAVRRAEAAIQAGYRRLKFKVSPTMHVETLVAVREQFPQIAMGLDANGSCGQGDFEFLARLAALEPAFVEQPFHPGRVDLAAALRRELPSLKLCLDESISDLGSLAAAHHLGALDEVNLKPGRVGGQLAALEIIDYCSTHGIPAWVGGMFETGVGRAANLRLAARLPQAGAHDLSPPSSYLADDIVSSPLIMNADGTLTLDDSPVDLDSAAMHRLTVQTLDLDPSGECP